MHRIISKIEVVFLFAGVILGILWVRNPSGNYESLIVLFGAVLMALEAVRRRMDKSPEISSESISEVKRLLEEFKSISPVKTEKKSDLKTEVEKKDEVTELLTEFFRQKRSIEGKLLKVAEIEKLSVASPIEAMEKLQMPDVFRTAMREYLNEAQERLQDSFSYLGWSLHLGETIEKLLENRLSTGAWG